MARGRDSFSAIVTPVARFFWELIAMSMLCTGLGSMLAWIAMADSGRMPWGLVPFLMVPSVLITWWSFPMKKRYMKWIRTDAQDY
jgi:hypothetical protein